MQSSCRIAGEQRVEVGEPVKSGSGAILALTQTPNTAVFPPFSSLRGPQRCAIAAPPSMSCASSGTMFGFPTSTPRPHGGRDSGVAMPQSAA